VACILLGWDDGEGGDFQLNDGSQIILGHPLVTELLISLNTDRAPDAGDPAPESIVRRGNWQRSFDPDAHPGSKLWMLRYVRPISRALVLAPLWAEEAYRWMVTTKRVLSITCTAERFGRSSIGMTYDVQIDAKARRRFLTEVPYVS
jgi:phage gp46-like protein